MPLLASNRERTRHAEVKQRVRRSVHTKGGGGGEHTYKKKSPSIQGLRPAMSGRYVDVSRSFENIHRRGAVITLQFSITRSMRLAADTLRNTRCVLASQPLSAVHQKYSLVPPSSHRARCVTHSVTAVCGSFDLLPKPLVPTKKLRVSHSYSYCFCFWYARR